MRITCPSCASHFELPSELLGKKGRALKCATCQHSWYQAAQVESFVERLGLVWNGTIHKDVEVWYYPECEVVRYEATTESRRITCVEFEALEKDSVDGALGTLERFERATGFLGQSRSHLSLPQLLFPEFAAATARQA